MSENLDDLLAHAKSVVNGLRKEAGLRALGKLKRGFRGSASCCVLAESLQDAGVERVGYDDTQVKLSGHKKVRYLEDPRLARFLAEFDLGFYPDLIVKRKSDIKIGKEVVIPKG